MAIDVTNLLNGNELRFSNLGDAKAVDTKLMFNDVFNVIATFPKISDAAPADGDVLIYDEDADEFVPGVPVGASVDWNVQQGDGTENTNLYFNTLDVSIRNTDTNTEESYLLAYYDPGFTRRTIDIGANVNFNVANGETLFRMANGITTFGVNLSASLNNEFKIAVGASNVLRILGNGNMGFFGASPIGQRAIPGPEWASFETAYPILADALSSNKGYGLVSNAS